MLMVPKLFSSRGFKCTQTFSLQFFLHNSVILTAKLCLDIEKFKPNTHLCIFVYSIGHQVITKMQSFILVAVFTIYMRTKVIVSNRSQHSVDSNCMAVGDSQNARLEGGLMTADWFV